mgnify:CR=1 FL=1
MADRLPRMAGYEIERTMVCPAELVSLELLIGFEGEIAVGIEHQLDGVAQFFLAQEQGIGGGS